MWDLSGKVAIVTGAASGIGRAIASRLVEDGATVIITDIRGSHATQTAEVLGCFSLPQDVTDEARWVEVVDEVIAAYGSLDVLVNNAGILGPATSTSPEDADISDFRHVMSVNVDGVFLGCRTAIRAMRRAGKGGSIVNVASVASELSTPNATAYGASKAAVAHLTKSVAQHCALEKLAIRCNSIHPGNVHTPLHDARAREAAQVSGNSFEDELAGAAYSPLGGWVPIEQISAAVSYLASDEASYVTGIKFPVDGGLLGCDTFTF